MWERVELRISGGPDGSIPPVSRQKSPRLRWILGRLLARGCRLAGGVASPGSSEKPKDGWLGANDAGSRLATLSLSFLSADGSGLLRTIDFTSGCVKAAPLRSTLFRSEKAFGP